MMQTLYSNLSLAKTGIVHSFIWFAAGSQRIEYDSGCQMQGMRFYFPLHDSDRPIGIWQNSNTRRQDGDMSKMRQNIYIQYSGLLVSELITFLKLNQSSNIDRSG